MGLFPTLFKVQPHDCRSMDTLLSRVFFLPRLPIGRIYICSFPLTGLSARQTKSNEPRFNLRTSNRDIKTVTTGIRKAEKHNLKCCSPDTWIKISSLHSVHNFRSCSGPGDHYLSISNAQRVGIQGSCLRDPAHQCSEDQAHFEQGFIRKHVAWSSCADHEFSFFDRHSRKA